MASNFNTLSYIFENEDIQEYAQENQKLITESVNRMLPGMYNNINKYVNNNIEQFMSNDLSDVYENISEYASNYVYENLDFGSFILSQEQIDESDRKAYYLEEFNIQSNYVEEDDPGFSFGINSIVNAGKAVGKAVGNLAKANAEAGGATPKGQRLQQATDNPEGIIETVKESIKGFSSSVAKTVSGWVDAGKGTAEDVLASVKNLSFGNNAETYIIASTGALVALVGIGAYANSRRLNPIIRDTAKKIDNESANLNDSDKSKISPMAKKAMECGKAKDAKCAYDNLSKMVDYLDKKGADTRKIKKNLSKIESQIKE